MSNVEDFERRWQEGQQRLAERIEIDLDGEHSATGSGQETALAGQLDHLLERAREAQRKGRISARDYERAGGSVQVLKELISQIQ